MMKRLKGFILITLKTMIRWLESGQDGEGAYKLRPSWVKHPLGSNHILPCNGFLVSFLPYNRDGMLPPHERVGTEETCETAVVFGDDGGGDESKTYLVLNGDYREAYEETRHDLSDAIDLFTANKAQRSYFSSDWEREREEAKSGGQAKAQEGI